MQKRENKKKFNKIVRDIKLLKIQGARNIAKKALFAYKLIPTKKSKKKLLSIRPTEPLLYNILDNADKYSYIDLLKHFDNSQEKINKQVYKIIKKNNIVFTHCHSSTVVKALIYSKKRGKKFEVYNTETRPILQGRITARELEKAGIQVTMFPDSALGVALSKEQGTKKTDIIFLGADALIKDGIINKIGSEVIAQVAKNQKIPLYILADSWKYSDKKLKMEQRHFWEVWKKPEKLNIKIKNPAFELVPKKYIKGIITELGLMDYNQFFKKIKKN